ncbi:MAG TPA: cytochrome c maturation protein CcmE [Candidatus Limnocylindria bacterium]|nr:cytochrome c maturation protein CcmE [Candidatus Limnocylindria bacterium]
MAVEPMGARRVLLIAVLAAAVLIGFVAVQNLATSAVYYLTPTEARERGVAAGTAARLGGQVDVGSLRYEPRTRELRFVLSDGTTRVTVIGSGAPPALLREGAGAVVEGTFAPDGTFRATQVIAKHDEQYAPPPPGATPSHRTP